MLQNRQFLLERGDQAPLVPKWGNILRAPELFFEVEIARSSEVTTTAWAADKKVK